MGQNLTPKQEKFCREYMKDLNGTQSAIRAGYSPKTANEQASRMLAKVNIQEFISILRKKQEERTNISADKVIKEFAKLGFSDIKDYIGDNLSFKALNEIKNSEAISSIKITEAKDGSKSIEFRLHDKKGALENLGKHLGIYETHNSQKNPYNPESPYPKNDLPEEWKD